MKTYSIILLAFLLVASCTIEEREPLKGGMLSQLNKLPHDASLVGYINFKTIRQSSLYDLFQQNAERELFSSPEYEEFVTKTGFDLQKDMHEFYFAAVPQKEDKPINGIFIARGDYDPEKLIDYIQKNAEEKDLTISEYRSVSLYQIEDGNMVFCFKDSNTIIGGKEELVKHILDEQKQDTQLGLLPQIKKLKYKNWAWMAMQAEPFIAKIKDRPYADRMQGLQSIMDAGFALKLSEKLIVDGYCTCTDADKAKLLMEAAKGAIAAAKLSMSNDRDAIDILNKIAVETDDNIITTNAEMERAEIEKMLAKRQSMLSI